MKKAIYPGTFDPVTNGHLDILQRACRMFDHVIIAVADNSAKGPLFSVNERLDLIEECIQGIENASAIIMQGALTVDFAKKHEVIAIVRGLRAISDFEFEFQMAQMNRMLDDALETVFFMPNEQFFFTSSHVIKQVAAYDTDRISRLIPSPVAKALEAKAKAKKAPLRDK